MITTCDTIYALSTILGKSGISVIRVSGPSCISIAEAYGFADKLSPGKLVRHLLTSIVDNNLIDECLIVYFKAPKSFTGEDVLEFHTHGSVAIIRRLLIELSLFENIRIAGPGEFSKRAFLNGKMDLSQAEGLSALIDSETEIQRQVAARQMIGEQGNLYDIWRKNLISSLAQLEAFIDFPTDDIPQIVLNMASQNIFTTLNSIKKHIAQGDSSEIIQRGIRVAIIGAPNAGKSTLINTIAKRDVAIVSEIAGTTRDVIDVKLDIAGFPFIFYDTAGIRDSNDIIEQEGVKRSYRTLKDADLCILVVDASLPYLMKTLVMHIEELQKPYIVVYNKIDLVDDLHHHSPCSLDNKNPNHNYTVEHNSLHHLSKHLQCSKGSNLNIYSIKTSLIQGDSTIEDLIDYIKGYAIKLYTPSSEPLLTSQRHRAHLHEAIESLEKFNLDYPVDIASQYVRMATNSLGQIVGEIDVEEVLDTIFSTFCIGK